MNFALQKVKGRKYKCVCLVLAQGFPLILP